MSSEPADGRRQSLELDESNTFSFLPGPMAGATCPACFKQLLLKEAIVSGECNSCGAKLELTLSVTDD